MDSFDTFGFLLTPHNHDNAAPTSGRSTPFDCGKYDTLIEGHTATEPISCVAVQTRSFMLTFGYGREHWVRDELSSTYAGLDRSGAVG